MTYIPASAKVQLVSGDNPTLHEVDQRVSTGKFDGDATGDHHKTVFEVPEVTGTVGDFINRLTGNVIGKIVAEIVEAVLDVNPDDELAIDFLLRRGDEINHELAKHELNGNSLRIALMDMQEQ